MSVDRIAPLPAPTAVEPPAARAGGASPRATAPAPAPSAATMPNEGGASAGAFFDSISLPLPDNAHAAPAPTRNAAYAQQAVAAKLPQLVDGRPPTDAVAREVETLLRVAAATRETTPARLIDDTPLLKDARRPAENAPDSRFSLHTAFAARDGDGALATLDLYLTRASARQWEATVFRRDAEAPDGGFPYPHPPISIDRVVIDPATGLALACVAQHFVPREFAPMEAVAMAGALRAGMFAVAVVSISVIIGKTLSPSIGVGFFVAAAAIVGSTPSRRRRR